MLTGATVFTLMSAGVEDYADRCDSIYINVGRC